MSTAGRVLSRLLLTGTVVAAMLPTASAPAAVAAPDDPVTSRAAAAADPSQPVRVLINGDSITEGSDGDWTWRYRLARAVERVGAPIDFVGSRDATHGVERRYADPRFDRQHFSTWGTRLDTQVPLIEAEVRKQAPDVVVMASGIVDLSYRTPAQVEVTLRQWIARARRGRPDVRILISPVLARLEYVTPATVAAFAARERAVAAQLSTTSSPITVADTDRGWNYRTLTWGGTHPNCVGETFIAQRVGEEMADVGLLPSRPAVIDRRCTTRRPTAQVGPIRFGARRIAWDAAPRADRYTVAYRTTTSNKLVVRTVRTLHLRVPKIRRARVIGINAEGRGPSRSSVRPSR